jgi:RNA polymerase sigma-70 factor, ECF subfamily
VVAIDAEERLRRLYDENYGRLLAYALGYVDRANAEEIVSDTFLVAWRRFDEVPHRELPWLLGVARNLIRERYRADRRLRQLCAELGAQLAGGAGTVAGDVAENVVERATALLALAALSDPDRELLTLLAWHGLTTREAAAVLHCSTAALLVRLHRARRRLQAALVELKPAEQARGPIRPARRRPLTDHVEEMRLP